MVPVRPWSYMATALTTTILVLFLGQAQAQLPTGEHLAACTSFCESVLSAHGDVLDCLQSCVTADSGTPDNQGFCQSLCGSNIACDVGCEYGRCTASCQQACTADIQCSLAPSTTDEPSSGGGDNSADKMEILAFGIGAGVAVLVAIILYCAYSVRAGKVNLPRLKIRGNASNPPRSPYQMMMQSKQTVPMMSVSQLATMFMSDDSGSESSRVESNVSAAPSAAKSPGRTFFGGRLFSFRRKKKANMTQSLPRHASAAIKHSLGADAGAGTGDGDNVSLEWDRHSAPTVEYTALDLKDPRNSLIRGSPLSSVVYAAIDPLRTAALNQALGNGSSISPSAYVGPGRRRYTRHDRRDLLGSPPDRSLPSVTQAEEALAPVRAPLDACRTEAEQMYENMEQTSPTVSTRRQVSHSRDGQLEGGQVRLRPKDPSKLHDSSSSSPLRTSAELIAGASSLWKRVSPSRSVDGCSSSSSTDHVDVVINEMYVDDGAQVRECSATHATNSSTLVDAHSPYHVTLTLEGASSASEADAAVCDSPSSPASSRHVPNAALAATRQKAAANMLSVGFSLDGDGHEVVEVTASGVASRKPDETATPEQITTAKSDKASKAKRRLLATDDGNLTSSFKYVARGSVNDLIRRTGSFSTQPGSAERALNWVQAADSAFRSSVRKSHKSREAQDSANRPVTRSPNHEDTFEEVVDQLDSLIDMLDRECEQHEA